MVFLIDLTLVRSFIKSKNFASPSRGFQVNDLSEKHFHNKDKMNGETTQGTVYGVEFNPSLVYLMEGRRGGSLQFLFPAVLSLSQRAQSSVTE